MNLFHKTARNKGSQAASVVAVLILAAAASDGRAAWSRAVATGPGRPALGELKIACSPALNLVADATAAPASNLPEPLADAAAVVAPVTNAPATKLPTLSNDSPPAPNSAIDAPVSAAPGADAEHGAKPAETDPVLQKISLWEKQFFSRRFASDPLDQRLARLEELIFGGVRNGSSTERVERIAKALNQQGDGPAVPPGVAEFVTAPSPPRTPAAASPPTEPSSAIAVMPSLPGQTPTDKRPTKSGDPYNLDQNPVRGPTLTVDKQQFNTSMKPQRVIQNLNDAIRDNPLDAELMYQRGKAFIQIDKPERALTDLSDAIMSQPNRSDFYLARAWVYHVLDNDVLSDLDISHAQFVDPQFPAKVVWK